MMSYIAACKNLVTTSLEAYHSALVAGAILIASTLRDDINHFLDVGYSTEHLVYLAEAKTLPEDFALEISSKIVKEEVLSSLDAINDLIEKLDNISISSDISHFSFPTALEIVFPDLIVLENFMEDLSSTKHAYNSIF